MKKNPNVGALIVRKLIYMRKESMCLSKVYVKNAEKGQALVEEAAKLIVRNGDIEVYTLFGEQKVLKGYAVKEIDLLKNHIILSERGTAG